MSLKGLKSGAAKQGQSPSGGALTTKMKSSDKNNTWHRKIT
jgi:hypothetical protein